MMNKITSAYCKEKYAATQDEKKIARKNLEEIIKTIKTKGSLPGVHINQSMIRTRAFCNNPLVFQIAGGQLSPMFDVEPQLVSINVNTRKNR